jgi:hypothetical protein
MRSIHTISGHIDEEKEAFTGDSQIPANHHRKERKKGTYIGRDSGRLHASLFLLNLGGNQRLALQPLPAQF